MADGRLPVVLLADDDRCLRDMLVELVGDACPCRVMTAADGAHAVQLALQLRPAAISLDLQMPRLDGVQAASSILGLLPSIPLALCSSDPVLLRERASELSVPLFDKLDLDRLVCWLAGKVASGPRGDFICNECGYGIVTRRPPLHCPLCQARSSWAAAPDRGLRRTWLPSPG